MKIMEKLIKSKLGKVDLENLITRVRLINEHLLIAQALELQKNVWLKQVLTKMGFDLKFNYNVNLKDGKIEKAKPPAEQTQPIETPTKEG